MRMQYENQNRKVDNLGRVTIPKSIRDRLGWVQNDDIEFYTMDNAFIVLSKKKTRDSRYDIAIEVLEELGIEVPKVLRRDSNQNFPINEYCTAD